MGFDHGVIMGKRHLARLPGGACRCDEVVDERGVEIQIILVDQQFLAARRDRVPAIDFEDALAVARQQVSLKQPQRFIKDSQIARRFSKGSDKRWIAENNPFHNESLQLKT
ncbi:MAG TPA: hypothetical protein VGE07_27400 [Herpetosiphonaceae bacterium]